jgi:hypothetical protein
MDAYDIHPDNTETIEPVHQTPKWHPGVKIHIAPSKHVAIWEEDDDSAFIKIFLDGSGIKGQIGAAVVLYHRQDGTTTKCVLCFCLDLDTRYTVYKGEVVGKIMAQELLHKETHGFSCHISMYINNQVSILSIQSNKPAPGHYLVDILHDKVLCAKKRFRNIDITVRWISSHLDVEGNEEVDGRAKHAVKGYADSPLDRIPAKLQNRLPDSKSTIKQAMLKALKDGAAQVLHESPQWRKLQRIDPTMPSNHY